ncbi:MAG: type II secretion system F family protein [Sulfurimonas sp.]|uniref:type II secretion system F family protein n=1 Tax=Sulfurimonas sp. TaxID=2022749 RepID=UPI002603B376|nr:type II secretion system F family protein [Sulfurimonas sp.]MCW8894803.1 type II secretion system F family protein [Sulfurimonas sp.]MCW8955012.1 type II secretion system F family protein [Sulfurimonas sp.]MCW9067926.1 type II secretion system F family protein [Sulfurimonas sp.]
MKIDAYTMLKTLHFTIKNGKSISSAMNLLANTAKTKQEKKIYTKIYDDIKNGYSFSKALFQHKIASLDVINFINLAEKGANFRIALEKIIHYIEVKDEFERESNAKTTLPIIYFGIASLIVLGVKFFAVPYQMAEVASYNQIVKDLVADHLELAQLMTDILFISLVLIASYFFILLAALFSQSRTMQAGAKQLALILPFTSSIVMKFEKFMLFSMLGEMLQSGISFQKAMNSAIPTTTVKKFKKAIRSTLDIIKHDGKFTLHPDLYDDLEQGLLSGVGTSKQIGSVMLEISDRARTDALKLSTKFFRLITILSIFLMAFAVFIEYYTIVLTQIIIQKGFIDASKTGVFN